MTYARASRIRLTVAPTAAGWLVELACPCAQVSVATQRDTPAEDAVASAPTPISWQPQQLSWMTTFELRVSSAQCTGQW